MSHITLAAGTVLLMACAKPAPPSPTRPTPAAQCKSFGAPTKHSKAVDGRHRGCVKDEDCVTVLRSCSYLQCTGVHRRHAPKYARPLDCRGYTGHRGNYDCRPRFEIERPICRKGCCVSERIR